MHSFVKDVFFVVVVEQRVDAINLCLAAAMGCAQVMHFFPLSQTLSLFVAERKIADNIFRHFFFVCVVFFGSN